MSQQACHPVDRLELSCFNRILSCVKYNHREDLNQLNISQMLQDKLFAIIELKPAFILKNRIIKVLNTTSLQSNKLEHNSRHIDDLRVDHNDRNDLNIYYEIFGNVPNNSVHKAVLKFKQTSPNNLMNLLKWDMQNLLKCGVCQIRTLAYLRIYVDNDGEAHYLTVCNKCVVNSPDNCLPNNVVNICCKSTYLHAIGCHM